MKPFSQASANNQEPIISVLAEVFSNTQRVLEIGSGTGQHAVYFSKLLPHLTWQTSDLSENHPGINAWIDDEPSPNLVRPIDLDVSTVAVRDECDDNCYDGIFSANTLHIMAWESVIDFFSVVNKCLAENGHLAIYGPFNYDGDYTSESNKRFDVWLKAQAPERAIRDFEKVNALAENIGLELLQDNSMPANNRLLVWQR